MKKLLLASAALMALNIGGNAVQAADMPVKAVRAAPVFSWSGCYVGGTFGYKWGTSKHTSDGFSNGVNNFTAGQDITGWFNVNGAVGGVEGGCQYQWGSWVWGFEADGSWSAAEGQSQGLGAPSPFLQSFTHKTSERWLATARGRIGYAWDKWLWYVTGGGAWTGLDINVSNIPAAIPPTNFQIDRINRGGWVVGYGTEYALAGNWSVKAESLYIDYGTFTAINTANCAAAVSPNCTNRDVRLREWVWRVGMNYRFDWGKAPAVVAKY